jgi:hypothetical protein
MGIFKKAWAIYRNATSQQRELTNAFAEIGVNFMHLDATFHEHVIKEAMGTNTESAVAKYLPVVESITILSGHVVTPEFNRRLMLRFNPLRETSEQEIEQPNHEL